MVANVNASNAGVQVHAAWPHLQGAWKELSYALKAKTQKLGLNGWLPDVN